MTIFDFGEVVKKVAQDLDKQVSEQELGDPFLAGHHYRVFSLNAKYFTPIRRVETRRKLAFVDGGNQQLMGAPNFSVQINRVYFSIFAGAKMKQPKLLPNKIEFFSITHADFRKGGIYYHTSMFPLSEECGEFLPDSSDLSFDSADRSVRMGECACRYWPGRLHSEEVR